MTLTLWGESRARVQAGVRAAVWIGMLLAPQMALAEAPSGATPPGATRLGVVDSSRALAGSRAGREIEKSLDKLQKQRIEALKPKTEKLQALRESYAQKGLNLNQQALGELQLDIRKLERSLERDVEAARDELEVERQRQLQPLLRKVAEAVNAIAGERDLDIVLEKSSPGVYFHADRVDITGPVIDRLNAMEQASQAASTPRP